MIWGCSRPADSLQSETIPLGEHLFTPLEIETMLLTNGVTTRFTLTDEKYAAPTAEWVRGVYSDKLTKFLFDYNLNHWTQESSDCDDISRTAAVNGSILFHNSKNKPSKAGFLFGEYHYWGKQGGHAINIAIVKDGPVYRLMFYEPQTKLEVKLTESDKFSSLWGRF